MTGQHNITFINRTNEQYRIKSEFEHNTNYVVT